MATTTFVDAELPIDVVGTVGSTQSLQTILTTALGPNAGGYAGYFLAYDGAQSLAFNNFSYWDPNNPTVTSLNGNGIIASTSGPSGSFNQTFVPAADLSQITLTLGNVIAPLVFVTVPVTAPGNSNVTDYIQYEINVVAPGLQSPTAGNGDPTPADIVASAERYAAAYTGVLNPFDCTFIAGDVAAAAGATYDDQVSQDLDPANNQGAGFWRIAYAAPATNPVTNWQTLVQAGDIIRMGWTGGGFHTTTVISVNQNGSMTVFDNADVVGGQDTIGIHTVNYDQLTIPTTITIYRLTTDDLYLINGVADEILNPSPYNNEFNAVDGDIVNCGSGSDVVEIGSGSITVNGGGGTDTALFSSGAANYRISHSAGVVSVVASGGGTDTLSGVALLQFTDAEDVIGHLSGMTVSAGSSLSVIAGGGLTGTIISSGGSEIVSAGGTDSGAQVESGGLQFVLSGGSASGTTVSSGGEQYIGSAGTSFAAQVQGGGAEVVFGTDSGANLSGTSAATATQYDFGVALGGTTFSNGFQEVALAGAVASGMTIAFGGEQYVGSGGTTLGAKVEAGGAEAVFGFDSGASVSGTQYDFGTASGGTTFNSGYQLVAPGATAIGMTVESGGQQYIGSGGTALSTDIGPQGAEVIFGFDSGALVSGTQYLFGVASGGTTFNGGSQQVEFGQTATSMTVSAGGQQYVGAGGTAIGTDIMSQGAELLHGTDLGATISGTQYVYGSASGTVVGTGGYQLVAAGGTISAASISGGTIELQAGASAGTAPITFTGAGDLLLDASTTFSGTVASFGSASLSDTIDFADISFVSAGSAGATTVGWSPLVGSGTLTVAQGGHTADITLLGQYAVGQFSASADGRGGTLITDPPVPTATDPNPQVVAMTQHA